EGQCQAGRSGLGGWRSCQRYSKRAGPLHPMPQPRHGLCGYSRGWHCRHMGPSPGRWRLQQRCCRVGGSTAHPRDSCSFCCDHPRRASCDLGQCTPRWRQQQGACTTSERSKDRGHSARLRWNQSRWICGDMGRPRVWWRQLGRQREAHRHPGNS
ncbi:unnamed protein product, partial [Symbiodinium sp. KB8]